MLSDAPWIRDAENDGLPSEPEPVCPVCGAECEVIYRIGDDAIGCENCVEVIDACDYVDGRYLNG